VEAITGRKRGKETTDNDVNHVMRLLEAIVGVNALLRLKTQTPL